MSDIQNLQIHDSFQSVAPQGLNEQHVHVRVQKRTGRKTLTTIQGLSNDLDFKKILKALKKEFCCNGTIVDDEELGKIIQLSGDQRESVSKFLIEEGLSTKSVIKIHGF